MKFPLPQDPFASFDLSPGKRVELERYADALVRESIDEYQTFVHHHKRVVDRKLWKHVKTRENVTVYKQKIRHEIAQAAEWSTPKVLGVGTIMGTMEDVLYGQMSPDLDCIRIKSSYTEDEVVDGRILSQIRYATDDDPFRFLGIKWLAKGHNPAFGVVVRPRDMVILDSMGIHEQASGERIGYHLMHSVELSHCPPLARLDIVRCKISTCFVFKEHQRNKSVEVYLTLLLEPGGSLPDSIAVLTATTSMIQIWKVVWCSQNKKLAWLTNEAARHRQLNPDFDGKAEERERTRKIPRCGCCERSISTNFRGPMACALCRKLACAKCRVAKQLSYVHGPNKVLVQNTTLFCVDCIVRAKRVNAADIARYEYVPGALAQRNFELLDAGGSARRERRLRLAVNTSSGVSSPLSAVNEAEEERETIVESSETWEIRQKLELEESSSVASSG